MKSETRSKIHSAAYGKAKTQKLPAKHGCGFPERDIAEQQTAAGDEENQRRQPIGDELRNAQRKDAEPFHQRQQGDQGQTNQFQQERHVPHLRNVIGVSS